MIAVMLKRLTLATPFDLAGWRLEFSIRIGDGGHLEGYEATR